jgi:hypothetical protein
MTITFESENDIIVYALEKIISSARNNQYIFLAQSVRWISSIIGLQSELISYLDNIAVRNNIRKEAPQHDTLPSEEISYIGPHIHPSRVDQIRNSDGIFSDCDYVDSELGSVSTTETDIHNEVIDNCEKFLEQSKQERKAVGRKNRQVSRIVKRKANKKKPIKTFGTQTEGIDSNELRRRKAAGECQRCAWPQHRKGSHKTLDCFRWKRLDKGTAPFPKKKK